MISQFWFPIAMGALSWINSIVCAFDSDLVAASIYWAAGSAWFIYLHKRCSL